MLTWLLILLQLHRLLRTLVQMTAYTSKMLPAPTLCFIALLVLPQLHRLSSTLVQATTYSQSLSNLQLLVGFIHAHRHAQDVLRQHIRVSVTDAMYSSLILVRQKQWRGRLCWLMMLVSTAEGVDESVSS
jgi:hypothetical protein